MALLILIAVAIAFIAFTGLVFTGLTLLLDWFGYDSFKVSGPQMEGAGFVFGLYWRNCIIAAVWTVVCLPLQPCLGIWLGGVVGLAALSLAYKIVFQAGYIQAATMGFGGGFVAIFLWVALLQLTLDAMPG